MSDCFIVSCWGVVDKAAVSHSKGHMCFPSTWREGDSCLSLWLGHLSNVSFLLDVWGCDLCKEGLWKRLHWSQPPSSLPPCQRAAVRHAGCMWALCQHRGKNEIFLFPTVAGIIRPVSSYHPKWQRDVCCWRPWLEMATHPCEHAHSSVGSWSWASSQTWMQP